MSFDSTFVRQLECFSGRAALFPLQEVACFPHVLLPLHIFQPRYRRMVADILDGDRLIAIAQLKLPREHREQPDIFESVCLACVAAEERLADGRYNLLVQGIARAQVVSEEHDDLPYRVARLELKPDVLPVPATVHRENRRRELLEALRDIHPRRDLDKLLHEAADLSLPLGLVCDLIAASLRLNAEQVQELLGEQDVDRRSDLLLDGLRELRRNAQTPAGRSFPPQFSSN